MTTNANLLASRLWPETGSSGLARQAVLAVLGSIFVALAAQVSVPMIPVPMTLQTLAVLAVGGAYGIRLGAATLALYAIEGAVGLPVFANFSGGYSVILGPTGGYIVGFILAAALVGYLVEKGWGINGVKLTTAMLLGAAVLYVPGLLWLAKFTGMGQVLQFGLIPFIPGDIVKAVLAAVAFPAAHSLLDKK
ncbi:MAG: biotin transporter BioY [Rhizobiales bacterium]|nr:biotin transporter BioY [Hyphomicrobiales bacterium]MBI3674407.1 biotin transporter BioY [Hyphomicrobiales bacterium]